jgi:hypothetical protein
MTASPARRARRLKRARPRKDERDQIITDAAEAFRVIYGLGREKARDLALGFVAGSFISSELGKFTIETPGTIKGLSDAVLRKHFSPRPTVVAALILLTCSKDEAAIRRCQRSIMSLAAVGASKQVQKLIGTVAVRPHIYGSKQSKKQIKTGAEKKRRR